MKKNQSKIKPLGDKVLILAESGDEKTSASGIIIPDTAGKERPEQGVVIAVGEGRIDNNGQLVSPKVKKGDRVIFSKYGPDELKVDGVEYLIVSESNILAIIEE